MNFQELRNDSDEILLVGPKQNNGEFDWFPLIHLEYTDEWGDECREPYYVTLLVVSPQQAQEGGAWEKACNCCGVPEEARATMDEMGQCQVLLDHGTSTPVWQALGTNKRTLLREARREAVVLCGFTFGFAMDRAVNALGTTGWECVRGEL